jgi:hypothetical protein
MVGKDGATVLRNLCAKVLHPKVLTLSLPASSDGDQSLVSSLLPHPP